jgi:hypothetical protein
MEINVQQIQKSVTVPAKKILRSSEFTLTKVSMRVALLPIHDGAFRGIPDVRELISTPAEATRLSVVD